MKDDNNIIQDILKSAANTDGYFKINYHDGFAMLTVFAPRGKGKKVYTEEVVNRMKLLNIPWVNTEVINKIIKESSGKPNRLVKWPSGAKLNPQIDIEITPDNMNAFIYIIPPKKGGDDVDSDDILDALKIRGILYGIKKDIIDRIVKEKIYGNKILVATGVQPQLTKNEGVKYYFNTNPGKPFIIDKYDRINLKELDFIQNVQKGSLIAEIIPSEPGKNGKDVFGKDITLHSDGTKSGKIKTGRNVKLFDNGKKIAALIDGNVFLNNNVIDVEPLVVVNNVDYGTGNIHSDGSIIIQGMIQDGFTVEAKGSIQVGKFAGKCIIKSDKDVILKAGMNGNNEGLIQCKGDIYARFIEGAKVECEGNLFLEESLMHSDVSVSKNILLKGKRAELIGGKTLAGASVWCKKLGSISGIKTDVTVGIDPMRIAIFSRLKKEIEGKIGEKKIIEEKKRRLEKYINENNNIADKIFIALKQLLDNESRLSDEINYLEKEIEKAYSFFIPSNESMLVVEDILFNGTTIHFGNEDYEVSHKDERKTVLKFFNNKIEEHGFNSSDPPEIKLF